MIVVIRHCKYLDVSYMLSENKDDIYLCSSSYRHAAASYGCMDVVELLLSTGANVNIKDSDGDTPLHFCEKPDIAQLLMLAGGDIFAKNDKNESILDKAIEDDNDDMIAFWILQGVSSKDTKRGQNKFTSVETDG